MKTVQWLSPQRQVYTTWQVLLAERDLPAIPDHSRTVGVGTMN